MLEIAPGSWVVSAEGFGESDDWVVGGLELDGQEAVDILQQYDSDGNGLLDLDEFSSLVRRLAGLQARPGRAVRASSRMLALRLLRTAPTCARITASFFRVARPTSRTRSSSCASARVSSAAVQERSAPSRESSCGSAGEGVWLCWLW